MDQSMVEFIRNLTKHGTADEHLCQMLALAAKLSLEASSVECPVQFENGICWPSTSANENVQLSCPTETKSKYNASRHCSNYGSWSQVNFSQCYYPVTAETPKENSLSHIHLMFFYCIYWIGYTISLFFLLVSLFNFVRHRSLWCLRNLIHCNLALCFACHNIVWILYSLLTQLAEPTNILLCWLPATCLKYFITASFFWMFAEGVHLVVLIVFAFDIHRVKFWMYALLSWGLPLILVTVATTAKQIGGQHAYCWKETEHGLDYIFIGPVLIVLLLNFGFMLLIMYVVISKLKTEAKMMRHAKSAKALLILCPLLGITYVLTLVHPSRPIWLSLVFEYYTVLVSASQGALVAVVFRFRKEAREHRDASTIRARQSFEEQTPRTDGDLAFNSRHLLLAYVSIRILPRLEMSG